jgi:hypothetical protein
MVMKQAIERLFATVVKQNSIGKIKPDQDDIWERLGFTR